jgi:hypothetical protein
MASLANPSYNMFPTAPSDRDFMLYPESQQPTGYTSPMDGQYSPDAYGFPPHTAGFEANPMYAYDSRGSPGVYAEDGELRIPSNMSTTSASSSNTGSPNSNPVQLAYMPEFGQNPLGVSPNIVNHGDFYTGTEYSSYVPQNMEEYAITYDGKPGFVGELTTISTTASPAQAASPLMLDTSLAQIPPPSPVSRPASSRTSMLFASPVSTAPSVFSPAANAGPQWSSPRSMGPFSPVTPVKTSRVSFFSQSSGRFVAPLDSSCWFPLVSDACIPVRTAC